MSMTRAVWRHVHNSSRFSRSRASLRAAVMSYLVRHNMVTHTEVGNNKRASALRYIPWWGYVHVEDARRGEDECAINFRRTRWRKKGLPKADKLSEKPIPARNGLFCFSLDQLFEQRRTGQTLMVCAFHLPTRGDGQLPIWEDCIDSLVAKVDGWLKDPDIDCIALTGDWNANWRDDDIRRYMRSRFPTGQFTWGGTRMPRRGGTHDSRLIDYSVVFNMFITNAGLLPDDDSSDHRPFEESVQLPLVR